MTTLFRIGLFLTLQCNAECRHCMFECNRELSEKMSRELAERIIRESDAQWISFTGGEPFLEYESLLNLTHFAHNSGLKTEVVTNGYWAEDRETAKKVLTPLLDAGLDVLNLSVDDYHQEFVPLENVKNAYWAAVDLGLKIVLMVSKGRDTKISKENFRELIGDDLIQDPEGSRLINPHSVIFETQFTPIGRGVGLEYEPQLFTNLRCGEALRDIGVMPNGDVLPCCGPLGTKITLGNLNEEPLESILSRAENYPRITRIRDGFTIEGCYSSKCHACLEN